MITHDFIGESTKSYDDAILVALYAATDFLSDMHDAQVFIKELRHTENGKDFFAMLEVTKDPLAPVYTRDEFEELAEQKEQASTEEDKFTIFRKKGYQNMKTLVAAHFKKKGQDIPSGIPDFILAPLTAVDIENDAIEKDFMFASEAMPIPLHSDTVAVEEAVPVVRPEGMSEKSVPQKADQPDVATAS
jgi:hypothetical protein